MTVERREWLIEILREDLNPNMIAELDESVLGQLADQIGIQEMAEAGAEIVMLDNFEPQKLKEVAAEFKRKYAHVIVEASGGITINTICDYISPHVDVVSQGSLTQGYENVECSRT